MKKTIVFLMIALFFAPNGLFAQGYAFKVLASKGTNEVKSSDHWQPLKTGANLKENDEIKLSENAYVGLVDSKGRPFEWKKPGSFKVSFLASQVKDGASVMAKYTDFILSSNSAEAKKARLSATGAVHRGDVSAISLMMPENQNASIFNNLVIVNWDGSKVKGPYVVTVNNLFGDELAKFETPETRTEINLGEKIYSVESGILISVRAKANAQQVSKEHLVKRLSPADNEKIKKSLAEISGAMVEPTALDQLCLAAFYEGNHLYIDAIAAYEAAIKLAPDVPWFQEAYDEFLIRNNLKPGTK